MPDNPHRPSSSHTHPRSMDALHSRSGINILKRHPRPTPALTMHNHNIITTSHPTSSTINIHTNTTRSKSPMAKEHSHTRAPLSPIHSRNPRFTATSFLPSTAITPASLKEVPVLHAHDREGTKEQGNSHVHSTTSNSDLDLQDINASQQLLIFLHQYPTFAFDVSKFTL
ncbi:hypothetical protein CF319_g9331 [Tilletia indica]|nr:hypothetical protein CF319_g9331 [Tilletia indica]